MKLLCGGLKFPSKPVVQTFKPHVNKLPWENLGCFCLLNWGIHPMIQIVFHLCLMLRLNTAGAALVLKLRLELSVLHEGSLSTTNKWGQSLKILFSCKWKAAKFLCADSGFLCEPYGFTLTSPHACMCTLPQLISTSLFRRVLLYPGRHMDREK